MKANESQVGGEHYKGFAIRCEHCGAMSSVDHWDVVAIFNLDYFQGQITRYVMRDKNKLEDLNKAAHYIEKYKEVLTAHKTDATTLELR